MITPQEAVPPPQVYIVLLNWNGWRDTVECLESLFRLEYPRYTVIVCDNASTDGSIAHLEAWARGDGGAAPGEPGLARLMVPPVPKPISLVSIGPADTATALLPAIRLVLMQTGANLGFAGGNNVGIRYALERGDCDYAWLLNNDTVVEPHSLSAMVQMAEADRGLGICGSVLRSYAAPHNILTAGGRRFSRWSGRTWPLQDLSTPHLSTEPGAPDYIEGASMLIRRRCLEQVGLLEEGYFLYCEEVDYVARMRGFFHFGYAVESVVYHKEGASIGSAMVRNDRSALSEFYQARNRLVFTLNFYPWAWPSVLTMVGLSVVQRLLTGKPGSALAILKGALASFGARLGRGVR